MNVVSQNDLELLEEYLDGALTPEQAALLESRLVDEPALQDALAELRSQRDARALVWRALEPTDAEANQLALRVLRSARRQEIWHRVGRHASFASAAAACLLLGFFAGWLGRDSDYTTGFPAGQRPVSHVSDGPIVSQPYRATLGVLISEIRFNGPGGEPLPMLAVTRVLPGSAAETGGLREGDLLLSVDGEPVSDVRALAAALSAREGIRKLRILRNRQIGELSIRVE